LLRELLEVEPNSKWCLLTLARLLQAQASSGGGDAKKEEANHLLSRLVELDPMRKGYLMAEMARSGA